MALTKIDDRGLKTPVDLLDNEKIRFGTGNDLEVYHDGTNAYIDNKTNNIYIRSNVDGDDGGNIYIEALTGETSIECADDSFVALYWDGSKKFETTSGGVKVTGQTHLDGGTYFNYAGNGTNYFTQADSGETYFRNASGTNRTLINTSGNWKWYDNQKVMLGSSDELQIYHDGTNSTISNSTGYLNIDSNGGVLYLDGSNVNIRVGSSGSEESGIIATANGAVELYYDNSKKFETRDDGIEAFGNIYCDGHYEAADNSELRMGTHDDLIIKHDGSHGYIDNSTGKLRIYGAGNDDVLIRAKDDQESIIVKPEAGVWLYYNNNIRFETNDEGAKVTGYIFGHNNYADSAYTTQNKHVLQSDLSGGVSLAVENSNDSNPYGLIVYFSDDSPDNNTNYFIHCADETESKFKIYSDGDVVNHDNSYGSISDVKLKENITDAGSQWNDVKAVKVRNFNFKSDTPSDKRLGVVAQELETVSPGLVTTSPDLDIDNNDLGTTTKSVKYSILYMKAFKALQETMAKIETLETKVAALEGG